MIASGFLKNFGVLILDIQKGTFGVTFGSFYRFIVEPKKFL
jgi:hypothetical protein